MTDTYKLIYFDLRTLAEPIRYIFQYIGIPFDNCCIPASKWVESDRLRDNFKWRQLPELHISRCNDEKDVIVITQAAAICRYLAKRYPEQLLMPFDALQSARCDEIVDAVQDLRLRIKPYAIAKFFDDTGNSNPGELKQQLLNEKEFLLFLGNINDLVIECQKSSKTTGHFIHGNNISWADFFLANFTLLWEEMLEEPDLLQSFCALKKQQSAVNSIPQIKMWIEKRPKTVM